MVSLRISVFNNISFCGSEWIWNGEGQRKPKLSISWVPPVINLVSASGSSRRRCRWPGSTYHMMGIVRCQSLIMHPRWAVGRRRWHVPPPISFFFTRLVAELGHEKRRKEAIWYLGPYTSFVLKNIHCFLGWSWQLGPHMETLVVPCRREPTRRRQGISARHTYQVIMEISCHNKKL